MGKISLVNLQMEDDNDDEDDWMEIDLRVMCCVRQKMISENEQ